MQIDCPPYNKKLEHVYQKMYQTGQDIWTYEPEMREAAKFFHHYLKQSSGKKLLDIGCGKGQDAVFFANCGYDVNAIDIVVHDYWHQYAAIYPNLKFFKTSVFDFKAPHLFDALFDNGCFHHLSPPSLEKYLKLAWLNLAGSGFLFISTFYNGTAESRIDGHGRLMRNFLPAELQMLAENSGFKYILKEIIYRPQQESYYLYSLFQKTREAITC